MLVPFPYSDLRGMKRRPACIVSAGAYQRGPDVIVALPGCVATGHSLVEVEAQMREAIGFHLEMMREHGEEIPPPTTVATAIAEVVTST